MSNRPMPAHHRTVEIPRHKIAKGYGVLLYLPHDGGRAPWQIVAAAPIDADNPRLDNWVRVIVAPARVPK